MTHTQHHHILPCTQSDCALAKRNCWAKMAVPMDLEPRAGKVCRAEEALATFPSVFYGEHVLAGNAFHQERGDLLQ